MCSWHPSYKLDHWPGVKLKLYNALGEEIRVLVNEEQEAGGYQVEFNATGLPSGVYFYRLQARDFIETNKMVLLR